MLLPSSIQRAEDLVGMAMPTVALSWAEAGTPPIIAAAPAMASARNVVFSFSMFHSLMCQTVFRLVENAVCAGSGLLSKLDVWLRTTARGDLQQKSAAGLRIGSARRIVHVLPGGSHQKARQIGPNEGGTA